MRPMPLLRYCDSSHEQGHRRTEHLRTCWLGIFLPSPARSAKTALLYGVVASSTLFSQEVLSISMNHGKAEQSGVNVRFWDFLFYASFGFVVTSSVAIAGVLLVFCYLIVPSVGAMLFADRIGPRLAIGWTMGTWFRPLAAISA